MHPRRGAKMQGMSDGIRMYYGKKRALEGNSMEISAKGAESGGENGIYY